MKKYLLIFLLLALPARADVLIGISAPLTGGGASFGEQVKAGAEIAASDINKSGGINGQPIKLVYEDDACDPKQGVAAANRLVAKKVSVVAGLICSMAMMPASDVYHDENMPALFLASSPQITEKGYRNIFRVMGRDDQQTKVMAEYIQKNFAGKRIALLHDKQTWGKGIVDNVQKDLAALKVKPALVDSITLGEKDFSALIARLKKENIDVVVMGLFPVEAGLLVRQSAEQKYAPNFIGADGLLTSEFWNVTGPAGNGVVFTGPTDPRKNPQSKAVIGRILAAGYKPELYTIYMYAAMQVAASAMNVCSTPCSVGAEPLSSDGIIFDLHGRDSFETLLGDIAFDEKGDLKKPAFKLYEWRDGKYDYLSKAM